MRTLHIRNFVVPFAAAVVMQLGCTTDDDGRTIAWGGDQDDATEDEDVDEPDAPPDEVPESEIYGGAPVPSCGWPSAVELGGSCSGTLVHPQLVIYAAHCGSNYSWVRLGESINGGQGRYVDTEHCETYPGGGPGDGDDFAFCTLAEPVNDVPIVPILMGCETDAITAGAPVTLVGFGEADNGPYGVKRQVVSTIGGVSANDEVFVGGGGKDTCQGDSGGPVFIELDDGTWRVFGITSYGGACGGGGYYSMMHNGIAWFESESGLDLTPCHDADGTWNPGADCAGFPTDPGTTHGTWANGCSGGPVSGASATCGEAGGDDGGGGDGGGDGGQQEPPTCQGCTTYQGTLTGSGDSEVEPDGNYYYAVAGQHVGELDGPSGVDFDLELHKWSGSKWQKIAQSVSSGPDETVAYNGTTGYYAWIVRSYSGSGSYSLSIDTP